MNNFKILAICWSFVWASCLRVLGESTVNLPVSAMPLIQLLTANATQAWTILPFYSFFIWGLGLCVIAAALGVKRRILGEKSASPER